MFAGKTTELLRKVKTYTIAKKKCLVVCSAKDNRYTTENFVVSHDQVTSKAMKVSSLEEILPYYHDYDVIAIDEGQFFPDITEKAEKFANDGKIVLIASLDGTYKRESFGNIVNLLPISEKITKLSAICMKCGADAAFTGRKVHASEVELIGGSEIYSPLCRKCYHSTDHTEINQMKNQHVVNDIKAKIEMKKMRNGQ